MSRFRLITHLIKNYASSKAIKWYLSSAEKKSTHNFILYKSTLKNEEEIKMSFDKSKLNLLLVELLYKKYWSSLGRDYYRGQKHGSTQKIEEFK